MLSSTRSSYPSAPAETKPSSNRLNEAEKIAAAQVHATLAAGYFAHPHEDVYSNGVEHARKAEALLKEVGA